MAGLLVLGFWALLIFLWGRPWLFAPVDESELAFEPDDVIAHRLGESRWRDSGDAA